MSTLPQPEAPKRAMVRRWAKLEPWLPTSSQQVLAYLKSKGYKIAKHRKTKRETTDEESLERLYRQHPEDEVLRLILEARRLKKAAGFLLDTSLGKDGRFHPQFSFKPKTGRLSCSRPNLMNQPQGKKSAEEEFSEAIRSTIIPSEGMTLGEVDWKAMESVLLGYFAEDRDYIRLAKLDVYSYFVSHLIGRPADLSQSDEALMAELSAIKKAHKPERDRFKVVILARGYGEGVFAISKQLECSFSEAKRYVDLYEGVAKKVVAWQDATRRRAHKEGFLENPFQWRLRFWDVFHYDREKQSWVLGSEANEALAFLPQSTGASMLKEVLLTLGPMIEPGEFHILTPVHDSLLIEAKTERLDHWMGVVKREMEREWPQLGGLKIETEGKIGPSWAEMEEWRAHPAR